MSHEPITTLVTIRLPSGDHHGPPVSECRHAVIVVHGHKELGYAIYDRLLSRIVDGVYREKEMALDVAAYLNEQGAEANLGHPPNGDALGLIYPEPN